MLAGYRYAPENLLVLSCPLTIADQVLLLLESLQDFLVAVLQVELQKT